MSSEPRARQEMGGDRAGADQRMVLRCPKCRRGWSLALDNVPPRIRCRKCDQWYRIDARRLTPIDGPAGEVMDVMVRSGLGQWSKHKVTWSRRRGCEGQPQSRRKRKLLDLRQWLQIAMVVSLIGVAAALWTRISVDRQASVEAALPNALEERIPLWTKAWLERDTHTLLRLSDRSRDRDLRRWLQLHQPPFDELALRVPMKIDVLSVEKKPGDAALVQMQIIDDSYASGGSQSQLWWMCRDGVWYFVPQAVKTKKR